jgi:hypothetical protein
MEGGEKELIEATRKQISKCGQGHRDYYLIDVHSLYPLPEGNSVSIRDEWNGNDYEELFEQAGIEDVKGKLIKAFNKRFEGIMKWGQGGEFYEGIDVIRLTLWDPLEPFSKGMSEVEYCDIFEEEVRKAVEDAGGDDDYYDYMPSFVDLFRQFCELAGLKDRYNKLAEWIEETQEDYNYYGPSRI